MSPPELAAKCPLYGTERCQFAPARDSRFELAAGKAQTDSHAANSGGR